MAQTVILVFDKGVGIIERLRKLSFEQYKKWILFPLLYEEKIVKKIELYLESQGCLVEKLQLQKEINESAFALRNQYIHFISEIGEKRLKNTESIKSWLKYPFCNYSLWWPSLVAEKNTVKSTSFNDLIKTYSILRQIKQQKISTVFLELSNRAVLNALMESGRNGNVRFMNIESKFNVSKGALFYYLRAIRSFLIYINRILMIKLKMHRSYKLRMRNLKDIKYLMITYFPLIDHTAIKKRQFINKLFQPIQNALKKKGVKYAWGAFIVPYDDYKFKDSVELGRNINEWNETLFFWEEALKFKDLIFVVLIFHWIALKYLFVRHKIRGLLIFEKDEIKINTWNIFKNECDDSFCGSVLMFNLLHYKIFKRVFTRINKETKILYPAEMQGWEKSLCAAAIENGRIKTLAIQHTAVPVFRLNYFFDRNEIESKYGKDGMPKPHKLACVGNIPEKLLMESGWQDNNVFVLGGIRFNHYVELIEKNIRWHKKKNKIIVALSIHPKESKEVISICLKAFDKEEGISVAFKGHPYTPVLPLLNSLKIKSLSPPFSISDTPLSNLLLDAKIIIVTESSATLEGLACHCQVVIPRLINALDLNPLTGLSDLPIYVNSPDELRRVAKDIMQQENSPYPRELALDFLKQYITFRSRDEEFLECIEAQFPNAMPLNGLHGGMKR